MITAAVTKQRQKLVQSLLPRVYLNGFPKCGLHLAEQIIATILRPADEPNWLGNLYGHAWLLQEAFTPEYVIDHFDNMSSGSFYKGHLYYRDDLSAAMTENQISTFLVVRDMRDVVVSQAYHVTMESDGLNHPGKSVYRALPSFEDVLIAVIEGIDEYPGIFERWKYFGLWLGHPRLYLLRFEDMRYKTQQTARDVAEWLMLRTYEQTGLQLDSRQLDRIAQTCVTNVKRRKTATFRRGIAGGWRQLFGPRVKESFKSHADDWLIWMQYETGNDW